MKRMKIIISIVCLVLSIQLIRTEELSPPQLSTECPPNSSFHRCITRCPLTCANYLNPPKGCVRICSMGCECHQGFIKVDKGPYSPCVRTFECSLYGKKSSISGRPFKYI